MVVSIYTLSNGARGFPFLHTLSGIYCFWWFLMMAILTSLRAICSDMDDPKVSHTDWSESERETQEPHINTCIWNLLKQYWRTYLQGRNRQADVENTLVEVVGEGESGTYWEGSTDICNVNYTLTTTCKRDSWWEAALSYKELSLLLCDDLGRWDGEGWRKAQEGRNIYIYI